MPTVPQRPFHEYDVRRAQQKWDRLCDARAKQAELEKLASQYRLAAQLHTVVVSEAQEDWNKFNEENN